jgi:hypothetical protein
MGKNPMLSPMEMPIATFSMRARYIAMSSDMEKTMVRRVNVSSVYFDFSALLPIR